MRSLLLATHFLPSSSLSSHLLLVLFVVCSSWVGVQICISVFFQNFVFVGFAVPVRFDWRDVEHLGKFVNCKGSFFGELDDEFDIKMAMSHRVFIVRHSESLDGLQLLVIDDLSRSSGDNVLLAVQVLDLHSDSSQSFKKGNLLDDDQISTSSLEKFVPFDLDADIDVTCNNSGLNKRKSTYSSFSPVKM